MESKLRSRSKTTSSSRQLLASAAVIAVLLCVSSNSWAQTVGNAVSFAIVGGQSVAANGGGSTVNGDVGINPAAATNITGFPANAIILPPYSNHGNDGQAIAASASALTLFNSAEMAPAGGIVTGADLSISGPTLNGNYPPGKYFVSVGTALLPAGGIMTLTAPGLYIFTVNSDLTFNIGSRVNLAPGVNPCNVWWRVPTQATLNGAAMVGNVVSNALIAIGVGAPLIGRALTTAAGSVTLAGTNTIGNCAAPNAAFCPAVFVTAIPNAELGAAFNHVVTTTAGTAPFTIALVNSNPLPAGLTLTAAGVLSGTPTVSGTYEFTIRATDALGCVGQENLSMVVGVGVPILPPALFFMLALGLMSIGYTQMRRRALT